MCAPFTVLALVVRLHFGLQVGKSPYTPTYAVSRYSIIIRFFELSLPKNAQVLDLRLGSLKNADKIKWFGFVFFSTLHASDPKPTEISYRAGH